MQIVDLKINRPDWMVKILACCEADKTLIGLKLAAVLRNLHRFNCMGKNYLRLIRDLTGTESDPTVN